MLVLSAEVFGWGGGSRQSRFHPAGMVFLKIGGYMNLVFFYLPTKITTLRHATFVFLKKRVVVFFCSVPRLLYPKHPMFCPPPFLVPLFYSSSFYSPELPPNKFHPGLEVALFFSGPWCGWNSIRALVDIFYAVSPVNSFSFGDGLYFDFFGGGYRGGG